jgi:hypothetical protein
MDTTAEELKSLLDREKIRECIALLARGEDRRDADLIRAGYWPDSTVDYGIFQGNFVIQLQGDAALVETHATNYHRVNMGDQERDIVMGGRYLDRLEKRDGEWRIMKRTMLYDWFQDFGESIDWSNGVMGAPFSAGHYSGRAVGDFSETFFGK